MKKLFFLNISLVCTASLFSAENKWTHSPFGSQEHSQAIMAFQQVRFAQTTAPEQSKSVIRADEAGVLCANFEALEKALEPTVGDSFLKETKLAAELSSKQFTFERFFSIVGLAIQKHNDKLPSGIERQYNQIHLVPLLQALCQKDFAQAGRLFYAIPKEALKY